MQIANVIIYVRNVQRVAAFYGHFFGMNELPGATDKAVRLADPAGGCTISIMKAAETQTSGAAMKIVFGVADVAAFKAAVAKDGLKFGAIWKGDGYEFANAKDPAGNSISISSRGMQA